MNDSIIARRYAKALFKLGLEKKNLEAYTANLKRIQQIIKQDEDFRFLIDNPVIAASKKKSIFKSLFEGKLHDDITGFFNLLIEKGREEYLAEIIRAFIGFYQHYANIQKVEFTSAIEFDQAFIQKIGDLLKEKTGKTSEIETYTDQKLIGGFVLRIGDQQLDNSVSGQLRAIKNQLSNKN
ncbi:ATP synthase F1 subunit delta [Salinivirga cyanobacteriivorans]